MQCRWQKNVEKCSSLTWFADYFLYSEIQCGKTLSRWEDIDNKYNHEETQKICKNIVKHVKKLNDLWPRFATHKEDVKLREKME